LVYINENVLFGQRNAIEEHKAAIWRQDNILV
jgi:hypothetical protein